MKLLTHNMLQCHIKGVQNGYPLKIEAEKVEVREMDYEPDFLRHIFPRIQWDALREGAAAMGERRAAGGGARCSGPAASRSSCCRAASVGHEQARLGTCWQGASRCRLQQVAAAAPPGHRGCGSVTRQLHNIEAEVMLKPDSRAAASQRACRNAGRDVSAFPGAGLPSLC